MLRYGRMVSIAEAERIRAERLSESRTRAAETRKRRSRDPHNPLITRGSPFANVSDQKHNIISDIPPSQSRSVRAQF